MEVIMRNRHHKSKSIISALPLADDIQNDICKIKKYKIPKGCSKEYIDNLKSALISSGGDMYYSVLRADDSKSNSDKINCLDKSYTYTTVIIQHLNKLAYIESLDARKATNIDTNARKYILRILISIRNKLKEKDNCPSLFICINLPLYIIAVNH